MSETSYIWAYNTHKDSNHIFSSYRTIYVINALDPISIPYITAYIPVNHIAFTSLCTLACDLPSDRPYISTNKIDEHSYITKYRFPSFLAIIHTDRPPEPSIVSESQLKNRSWQVSVLIEPFSKGDVDQSQIYTRNIGNKSPNRR